MSNKELELADSAMKHKKVSEMKTEERNELVSKLKQAAMGPRLAALQIQLLDQMIAGLKKRRQVMRNGHDLHQIWMKTHLKIESPA